MVIERVLLASIRRVSMG